MNMSHILNTIQVPTVDNHAVVSVTISTDKAKDF